MSEPGHRHAQRHLFAGRAAVRAADRDDAVRQGAAAARRPARDAADDPRGRAAQAEHAAEHAWDTLARRSSASGTASRSKLRQLVRGELDWIVMKALEKDRKRRYETANGLAADVERVSVGRTGVACPPSVAYRFRKFARRHRGAVRAASMATVMVLLARAGLGWSIRDREARRSTAEAPIDDALQHAAALVRQRNWPEASTEAKRAQGLVAGAGGSRERAEIVERLIADLEMVARLEEIRLQRAAVGKEGFDFSQADPAYADAFRAYGFDIEKLDTVQAATALRAATSR